LEEISEAHEVQADLGGDRHRADAGDGERLVALHPHRHAVGNGGDVERRNGDDLPGGGGLFPFVT
jgi:hypothetical protein